MDSFRAMIVDLAIKGISTGQYLGYGVAVMALAIAAYRFFLSSDEDGVRAAITILKRVLIFAAIIYFSGSLVFKILDLAGSYNVNNPGAGLSETTFDFTE